MPSLGLKSFKKAAGRAASAAKDLAVQAKEEIGGPKSLRDYSIGRQVATAGPEGLWKIFAADVKRKGPEVPAIASVWVLDKKNLPDANKGSKLWDIFIERQRRNSVAMLKLKHPGIVKILEPLEETRNQLVMVTEAIYGSVDSVVHSSDDVPGPLKGTKEAAMSELEVKHGVLQVADVLHFLHNEAGVAHCGISPKSVLITAEGAWKVACFDFSVQINVITEKLKKFNYSKQKDSILDPASRPNLDYVAPELAGGHNEDMATIASPACDMFSLGLVAYEALTGVRLVDSHGDIVYYKSKAVSLAKEPFSGVPAKFEGTLRTMLSLAREGRPQAADLSKCPYFQEDLAVRALVFLDGFVQRDDLQKASFLKDLDGMWEKFDARIIRYKVLPHILKELRNESLAHLLFPYAFKAMKQQNKAEFKSYTLPVLQPILAGVKGEPLVLVLRHCDDLLKLLPKDMVGTVMLPLVTRAFTTGDPKAQEVALKAVHDMCEYLQNQTLQDQVLPRVHEMALATQSATVRINALVLMGTLVDRVDEAEAGKMLSTAMEVTSADQSPGTLMCVLGVGNAISKSFGEALTAQKVIPLLSPLLVCHSLSHSQFSTYITLIREMLSRIEKKMGSMIYEHEPVEAGNSNGDGATPAAAKTSSKPSEQLAWTSASFPPPAQTNSAPQSSQTTSNPFENLDALFPSQPTAPAPQPTVSAALPPQVPNPPPSPASTPSSARGLTPFASARNLGGRLPPTQQMGRLSASASARTLVVPKLDAPGGAARTTAMATRSTSGSLGRAPSQRLSSVAMKPTSGVLDLGLVSGGQPVGGGPTVTPQGSRRQLFARGQQASSVSQVETPSGGSTDGLFEDSATPLPSPGRSSASTPLSGSPLPLVQEHGAPGIRPHPSPRTGPASQYPAQAPATNSAAMPGLQGASQRRLMLSHQHGQMGWGSMDGGPLAFNQQSTVGMGAPPSGIHHQSSASALPMGVTSSGGGYMGSLGQTPLRQVTKAGTGQQGIDPFMDLLR